MLQPVLLLVLLKHCWQDLTLAHPHGPPCHQMLLLLLLLLVSLRPLLCL
jgi:hypothetical protein